MGMVRVKLHHLIGNHTKIKLPRPGCAKNDVFQGGVQKGLAKSAWRNLENRIFDFLVVLLGALSKNAIITREISYFLQLSPGSPIKTPLIKSQPY